ncbi:MAG TPA: hypothetical protein VEW26_08280, partial [Allosphingosinicella sp.]|nr:hypothetical protein [Allosphingosinicella sp.]
MAMTQTFRPLRLILGMAIAVQLAAAPASAQRTGSRIGRNAEVGSAEDAAALTAIVADCIAERRKDFVRRWFAKLPGTQAELAFIRKEEGDLAICMDNKEVIADGRVLNLTPRSLRLPTARAIIARMVESAPAQSPVPPDGDPWFLPLLAGLPADTEVDRPALAFQDFGHCVATRSWRASLALLASSPGSADQAGAVRRLTPALGPCLTDDVKITITPANLRDILAEPVYHILT